MEVENDNNSNPVVIENGSRYTKAGFAGDDAPRAVFPSIVGRVRFQFIMVGTSWPDAYVGDEAQSKRGILAIECPIEHGIITNWDDIEKIWHHTFFKELCVDPKEHPILQIDAPLNPKVNRGKITQILFETFGSPAVYLSVGQVLSLYSVGCTTGLVVDSGFRSSRIVPVHKGQVLNPAVASLDIGGAHLTEYLVKLLSESGYSLTCGGDTEIINDIKEKLCYISVNREEKTVGERMYELPDGQEIRLRNECFRCPEPIFQPSLIGFEEGGLHMAVDNTVNKFDEDLCKHLSSNIVLAGGNTLFPGMAERLRAELSILSQGKRSYKVKANSERRYSSWIGGSVLASMDNFDKICVSKDCYEEYGPEIVYRKFF